MHDEPEKPHQRAGRPDRPDGLDDFADKLRKARVDAGLKPESPRDPHATRPDGHTEDEEDGFRPNAFGMAMRLSTDLVAAVLVGGFIGWMLDRWLGTEPILLLIFFPLGVAAGIVNVFRTANEMNKNANGPDNGADGG